MKQLVTILSAVLFLISCNNTEPEALPESSEWYVLRAPENRDIQAAYGDMDDILLITDRFHIYYTKDKGKSWNKANYNSNIGLAGFTQRNDTLFVLNTQSSNGDDPGNRYAARPYYFSLDKGISWQELQYNAGTTEMKTPLNFAHSGNGVRFKIDQVIYENGMVEDKGIVSEYGSKYIFPQHHALSSVYFDKKSRLYVSGSAPLCDIADFFQPCDKQDASGTLYISKNAITN